MIGHYHILLTLQIQNKIEDENKLVDLKNTSILTLGKEKELKLKDPIFWFSLIPPDGIVKSQQFFKQSIETSAKLANLKIKMEEIELEYKKL